MAAKDDIREFLTTRRAKIAPERAGLPVYGANRRVAGLRREEVALLAGISVEYYTRLERGSVGSVSDAVLDGLVHALQLDEAERDHLFRLVHTASTRRPHAAPRPRSGCGPRSNASSTRCRCRCRPTCATDASTSSPPTSWAGPSTAPSTSRPTQATTPTAPGSSSSTRPPRSSSSTTTRRSTTASRSSAPRRVATPTTRPCPSSSASSPPAADFRRRWVAHDVRYHRIGRKRFHHPLVGDLELDYEALELPGDPGRRINIYTAEPGSPSAEALSLLASWASTPNGAVRTDATDTETETSWT